MRKSVVITGIGVVSPYGIGKEKFWNALSKGKSAIKPITLFSTRRMPCRIAGEVSNFNPRAILGSRGLRNITRCGKFAICASKLALDDARLNYPISKKDSYDYGVSLGTVTGSMHSIIEFDRQSLVSGPRAVNPAEFPNTALNTTASYISIKFNIKGFNTTIISSSLSSSLDAVFYATSMIKDYGYKVVLAGGAEELTYEMFIGLIKLKCLARSKSLKDKEISCPYDRRRNGIIFSEGSAIFILEELGHALKRKAKIYAEVKGFGFGFEPKTTGVKLGREGAITAIREALSEYGCPEHKIDCIIGSANSTKYCDATEAHAINSVFGDDARRVPVSSIKSMIGEGLSAGGAFNLAAAAGVLEHGFIPPTINYHFPDKNCNLNIITKKSKKFKAYNILVNSFSYDGPNSSIVVGKTEA